VRILLNGVCVDEDCQYKYNMDTCYLRYECSTELLTSEEYNNRDRDEDVCKACWDGTTSKDEVTADETNEAECIDCQNCGTTLSSPYDARKCYVYDPNRCNGTGCFECVDGEYCEPCQRGFDSDHEDREDKNAGDECYGSRSCKTLTLTMAGGGSHWWHYVMEGDKVYIENSEGRELQEGLKLVERVVGGTSYLRLVREGYELSDDEHEVQPEEDR